jgi:hypothetical protein
MQLKTGFRHKNSLIRFGNIVDLERFGGTSTGRVAGQPIGEKAARNQTKVDMMRDAKRRKSSHAFLSSDYALITFERDMNREIAS